MNTLNKLFVIVNRKTFDEKFLGRYVSSNKEELRELCEKLNKQEDDKYEKLRKKYTPKEKRSPRIDYYKIMDLKSAIKEFAEQLAPLIEP